MYKKYILLLCIASVLCLVLFFKNNLFLAKEIHVNETTDYISEIGNTIDSTPHITYALPHTELIVNKNLSFNESDLERHYQGLNKYLMIPIIKPIYFKFDNKIYEHKDDILISDDDSYPLSIDLITMDNQPLINHNNIKLIYDKAKIKNISMDKNQLLIEPNDYIDGKVIIGVVKYDSNFNISYAFQINLNIEKSLDDQFNELSPEIQSIMVTTLVDSRIMGVFTPENSDRPSYFLIAQVGDDFWQVCVHSGVGFGHPIYLIKEDAHYVWPVYANVWDAGEYEEVSIPDKQKVAKNDLYDEYIQNKDYFDSIKVMMEQVTYSFDAALEKMEEQVQMSNH